MDREDMATLLKVAEKVHASGVCPPDHKNADQTFAVMLAGAELGLGPMQSIRSIQIVKGKLSNTADFTIALCVRAPVCEYFRLVESTAERATYETHRRGAPKPTALTYALAQAQRAGLTASPTWKSHPEAMLRARCAAALARAVYPDLVAGIYTPDEAEEIRSAGEKNGDFEGEEGSRAFAAFVLRLASLPTVGALLDAYHGLIADLREEGRDPAEFLADGADPAALGAASLVGQRVFALGHRLARVDLTALLTDGGEKIALALDSQAEALAGKVGIEAKAAMVEWWRAHRGELAADKPTAKVVFGALVRRWEGSDEPPDGPRTKKARGELERALEIADKDAGRSAPEPTSASPQARRVREVMPGTEAEIRAHVGRYGHPRAIENAARKYAPMAVLHRALAERLMAVAPADSDGTRLTDRGALLQVEAWSKQEPAVERKAVGR